MDSVQIDILNPKAARLLEDLADLQLIFIHKPTDDGFMSTVQKFRENAKNNPPSLKEIIEEVELVRAERYARSKK